MKQGPPQGPPNTKSGEKKTKVMSLKEFNGSDNPDLVKGYNNFFFRFSGKLYSNSKYYKRFRQEYPDMDRLFREKVKKAYEDKTTSAPFKSLEKEAYEIYKIMRGYGASDQDLVS